MTVTIPLLHIEFINEFDQKLLAVSVNHFRQIMSMSVAVQKFRCELGHFSVQDKWTKSKQWSEIITTTALSDKYVKLNPEDKNTHALTIEFEKNDELVEKVGCPVHLDVTGRKPLRLVVNFPLVGELLRTIEAALQNQKLDLAFFAERLWQKYFEIRR